MSFFHVFAGLDIRQIRLQDGVILGRLLLLIGRVGWTAGAALAMVIAAVVGRSALNRAVRGRTDWTIRRMMAVLIR